MREDLYVHEKIVESGLVQRLGYRQWMALCIQFVESRILSLDDAMENARADLADARLFLEGGLSEEALLSRQDSAWSRYRKSRKEGRALEEKVQRLTVIFLYPDFLCGIENDDMPDSHEFLFLRLIDEIRPGLCRDFLEWVEEHGC